jgi:hypothetical protein
MKLPTDISEFISVRFAARSQDAVCAVQEHLASHPEHADRVLRCILILSGGSMEDLPRVLDTARADPRDVMFWAEYTHLDSDRPRRVRDFSRPFTREDIEGTGRQPIPPYKESR